MARTMGRKDESEYKTTAKKREYNRQWRLRNPGYHSKFSKKWNADHSEVLKEYGKEYREANKQNVLYMATIDDEYYFGQTSKGIDTRKGSHIHNSKYNRSCGNPRMRELYKQLGEDEFRKRITFKVIKTFDTPAEAKAAEKLMLEKYVGQPGCMNKHK
jgi:hypothetical protein